MLTDPTGLKWIVNPDGEFAVEAALRLKEKHGGKVTILSYGSPRVMESMRTVLAMGADEAVLIAEETLEESGWLKLTTQTEVVNGKIRVRRPIFAGKCFAWNEWDEGAMPLISFSSQDSRAAAGFMPTWRAAPAVRPFACREYRATVRGC